MAMWAGLAASAASGYLSGQTMDEGYSNARDDIQQNNQLAQAVYRNQLKKGARDLDPWITAGKEQLGAIREGIASGAFDPGQFRFNFTQDDPSYRWRLSEGLKGVNEQMASRGMSQSGAAMKALNSRAQNEASQEYQNEFNRYATGYGNEMARRNANFNQRMGVMGAGQNAVNSLNAMRMQYAGAMSGMYQDQGNTLANMSLSQAQNQAQTTNKMIGNGLYAYQTYG